MMLFIVLVLSSHQVEMVERLDDCPCFGITAVALRLDGLAAVRLPGRGCGTLGQHW